MAAEQTQIKTNQSKPRSSCFLGCFGFSGKNRRPLQLLQEKPSQSSTSRNKTPSWLMFRLSCMRKSRTKTVPVDNNTEKPAAESDSKHTSKLIKKKFDCKLSSKPRSPTIHKASRRNSEADQQVTPSTINQTSRERHKETRQQGPEPEPEPEPNIILGNRKLLDPTRTRSTSLPGSPVNNPKPKSKPKTTHPKLSHTVSLPVLEENQRVGKPRNHASRINSKELQLQVQRRKNNEVVEKLDPVMGMSIIMVTLIIMIFWGRLCAILCTSAWFYFCPRFRTKNTNNDISTTTTTATAANSDDLDFYSEEYKKKVVLEGLLERNHRITQ